VTNTLLPDMSREFLTRMLDGKPMEAVRIGVSDQQLDYHFSDVG
jgi:type VI secretion system protein VasG